LKFWRKFGEKIFFGVFFWRFENFYRWRKRGLIFARPHSFTRRLGLAFAPHRYIRMANAGAGLRARVGRKVYLF
jgi:hypothetical protein